MPTTGKRLRASRPKNRRLHPPRHDPHHAQTPRLKPLPLNHNFPVGLSGHVPTRYSPVRHSRVATSVRLACVKPAASVRSEPGSNSQVLTKELRQTGPAPKHQPNRRVSSMAPQYRLRRMYKNSKADSSQPTPRTRAQNPNPEHQPGIPLLASSSKQHCQHNPPIQPNPSLSAQTQPNQQTPPPASPFQYKQQCQSALGRQNLTIGLAPDARYCGDT